ncbi:MAG: GIY-YIG nuclease family protein [Candidatus Omnitrophota bacterium]
MYYVYILRSKRDASRFYIGYTTDVNKRLKEHNESRMLYTKRYTPWCVETYISFTNQKIAKQFERYLKSGSGKTFLKRRLMAL